MAYRIVYSDGSVRQGKRKLRPGAVLGYTAVCLALWGVLTVKFWPEGREALAQMLLPGDPAVTRQALVHMAANLRSGEAIGDAIMVFCREIVDGADLPD